MLFREAIASNEKQIIYLSYDDNDDDVDDDNDDVNWEHLSLGC